MFGFGNFLLVAVGIGHMAVGYMVQGVVVAGIDLVLVGNHNSDTLGFGFGNHGFDFGFQGIDSGFLGSGTLGIGYGFPGCDLGSAPECHFWAGLRGICSFYFY